MRWKGLKNGELLTQAQDLFDIFVTVDKNLQYQQHIPKYDLSVIVLDTPRIDLPSLLPLISQIKTVLSTIEKHQVIVINRS